MRQRFSYSLTFAAAMVTAVAAPACAAVTWLTPTSVPEPSTWLMLGSGILIIGYVVRRKTRK